MTLYLNSIADANGEAEYLGIKISGRVDWDKEFVFMTSLGQLRVDEFREKRRDRVITFILAVGVAIISAFLGALFQNFVKNQSQSVNKNPSSAARPIEMRSLDHQR
jgi:hypothetical protein